MAANGTNPPRQESLELVARDFDGKVLWKFDHNEEIRRDGRSIWSARQHHDWQREDYPAGYYSPGAKPSVQGGNTLILTHTNHVTAGIADVALEDDRLIEVSPKADIVWQWLASDHVEEFGFSPTARAAIKAAAVANPGRGGGPNAGRGSFDWLHINAATYVGPNRWFDAGDRRFAPTNVIISSRQSSFVAIVGRDGKVAWRIGPDFLESKELRAIRQIIGQHHPHLIPKGLPGAGNLLVFDNGGSSGYGAPTPVSPDGSAIYQRAGSRVLEINPVTLELVWSFTGARLFSTNISSAQRLPNGNTLITEGAPGRLLEVTNDRQVVWEYIYPVFGGANRSNGVYRGYRVPYDWIPQLTRPAERAIVPPPNGTFRVPAEAAAQPAPPAPQTAPAGEIVGVGNFAHIVANVDRSLGFYRDVLGLAVTGTIPFGPNDAVAKFGHTEGGQSRVAVLRVPGLAMGIELIEYKDIERKAQAPRFHDPGAANISLRVRNLDALFPRIAAYPGVKVLTAGGKPATLTTPNGSMHAVFVQDPDGFVVEMADVATPPADAGPGPVLGGGGFEATVRNSEETVRFYNQLLGFGFTLGAAFNDNQQMAATAGAPGASFRQSRTRIPGTAVPFTLIEFKNIDRKELSGRTQDPGTTVLQLIVRDVAALTAKLRAAGVPIVTTGGAPVQVSPALKIAIVKDPNGMLLELVERAPR
jgi:catechol 2,3-dioxygenase-like lactoylglutathione lyase family enzyme